MPLIRTTGLVLCTLFAALWLLGLSLGVWLPDVFLAPRSTLARASAASGYSFQVIQYWNRVDFYTTELHVVSPTGTATAHVLDGDDSKSWRVGLRVDETNRLVLVTLGGGRERKVRY